MKGAGVVPFNKEEGNAVSLLLVLREDEVMLFLRLLLLLLVLLLMLLLVIVVRVCKNKFGATIPRGVAGIERLSSW